MKRATIYFDAKVSRALRLRAAACKRSISDIESQRVHGQAGERGHDLDAVDLAVSVGILLELGVAGPVPGVLDRPTVTHVTQQSLRASSQTRVLPIGALSKDVVPSLVG